MINQVRFEIIVTINGANYYLDTYETVPVPTDYLISDINDISTRQGSRSLTIVLPETSNNRFVFSNISDLSTVLGSNTYDPNLKAPVSLLVDSIVVFSGNLQLTSVDVDIDTNENKYNCVVYSENDDFFSIVGDSYLTDLDLTIYNHTYSIPSVTDSWTSSFTNGYYYPLIDYGYNWDLSLIDGSAPTGTESFHQVFLTQMFPATYIKAIWNAIFESTGYNYNSNFLNSDTFDNLLMPFSGKVLFQDLDFYNKLKFKQGIIAEEVVNHNYFAFPILQDYSLLYFDDGNPPYFNVGGNWVLNTYTNAQPSPSKQQFGFNMTVGFTTIASQTQLINPTCTIRVCRSRDPLTGITVSNWGSTTVTDIAGFPVIPFGGSNIEYSLSTNEPAAAAYNLTGPVPYFAGNIWTASVYTTTDPLDGRPSPGFALYYNPLYPGEEVRVYLGKNIGSANFVGSSQSFISNNSYLFNQIDPEVVPGQPINYNSVMPNNVKQKDFLTSIIKMFNLYIEPNKDFPKLLNIEPRNDYYAAGIIKDWTEKLDISQPIMEQILAETQNRSTLLTYKPDTDFWNTDYTGRTKEIYGQFRYIIDNDFINGEKKIDNIFSPTPLSLLEGSTDIVMPIIFKLNNGIKQKADSTHLRILRKATDGLVPISSLSKWFFQGVEYDSYPYIGHFNDPYIPTEDINWGQSYLYYANAPTNNNLFTVYWQRTLDEISDINSRIITVKLFLTAEDINKFYFNDNIFLMINGAGQYYKVNKITGYDPTQLKTTTVELLKTKDITVPNPANGSNPKTENIQVPGPPISVPPGSVVTHTIGNQVYSKGNIIAGIFNIIDGTWTLTVGENNINRANVSFITGYNNVGYFGQNQFMIGNNNTISNTFSAGVNNASIFGDYNFLNGSNSFIVGTGNTGSQGSYIFGNNNIIGTNSYAFGNNIIGTQSNNLYINLPIIIGPSSSITGFTAATASGASNSMAYFDSSGSLNSIFTVLGTPTFSLAEGASTIASGFASHAEGLLTQATNQRAHAEGNLSIASGISSHAQGDQTLASEFASHAEGFFCTASGFISHASGFQTLASGTYSYTEGNDNIASDYSSHAEGNQTVASAQAAHSEGNLTTASGNGSHAEGFLTAATNSYAHAEGSNTSASGLASHAEGNGSQAVGTYSHAEGQSISNGISAHAEGQSQAVGDYSHAEGSLNSVASGFSSHAGGVAGAADSFNEWCRGSSATIVAQYGIVSFSGVTTNATLTQLFLDYPTNTQIFNIGAQAYSVRLFAVLTDIAGDSKEFSGSGIIKNIGGNTTLVAAITMTSVVGDVALATTSITVTADNATDSLKVEVTGVAATTINWLVRVDYDRVST